MKFTPKIEQAINRATYAHRHQTRKGSDVPYIVHPFGVMLIASQVTTDEDTLIACLLHDILEDVPEEYSKQQMLRDFGENVVTIVEGITKDSTLPEWQARQEAYLKNLSEQAPDESIIVSCADKIHNLTATLRDHEEISDVVWQRFNASKSSQQWWYESVLQATTKRLPGLSLNHQLAELIEDLKAL